MFVLSKSPGLEVYLISKLSNPNLMSSYLSLKNDCITKLPIFPGRYECNVYKEHGGGRLSHCNDSVMHVGHICPMEVDQRPALLGKIKEETISCFP